MFHFVSHDFANFHWTWRFGFFACVLLGGFCVLLCLGCCVFPVKILHSIRVSILSNFQLLTDNVSYSIGNAGKKKDRFHCSGASTMQGV